MALETQPQTKVDAPVEVKPEPIKTAELLAKLGDTAYLAGNNQPVGLGGGSH